MALFSRTDTPFNRTKTLEAASRAKAKGNLKKAIAAYREVLVVKADDLDVHLKLAPLLAETKQLGDAWRSYLAAGEGFTKKGFADKAVSVYRQASQYLPHEVEIWERISDLCLQRERRAEASKTLVDAAASHFKKPAQRADAIRLLRKAAEIEPDRVLPAVSLARLLRQDGQRDEACALLERFLGAASPKDLPKLRRELFLLGKSPASLWRWLRASVVGR